MRVLFDHQIFVAQRFGGISRYFNELSKMQERDVSIEKIDPDLISTQSTLSKKVFRGVQAIKRRAGLQTNPQPYKLPQEIINTLSAGDYDLLHPTYYDPYFLAYTQKSFVLTVYDMTHEIYKESFMSSDRDSTHKRMLCSKATEIIAISNTTKQDLVDIFNIPEEKIHAIPLASDFDKVVPAKSGNLDSLHLKRYILFVGARWVYKNFYYATTALANLLKEDKDLELLCTGHPFSADEIRFFEELGIRHKVKHAFLNSDAELAWAYQNAQLFIFPSMYEGFGFPLLEAFASRCPVISSNGGSLPEVGGEGALYFDPKNIRQIQDAAHSALYNPATRSTLIEKGLAQYQKFSWDECRKKTAEVYKKAGAKAGAL